MRAEQQRLETAAQGVATKTKLEAFFAGLTPDEHRVPGRALRHAGLGAEEATEDAAGYSTASPATFLTWVRLLRPPLSYPPLQPGEPSS